MQMMLSNGSRGHRSCNARAQMVSEVIRPSTTNGDRVYLRVESSADCSWLCKFELRRTVFFLFSFYCQCSCITLRDDFILRLRRGVDETIALFYVHFPPKLINQFNLPPINRSFHNWSENGISRRVREHSQCYVKRFRQFWNYHFVCVTLVILNKCVNLFRKRFQWLLR